MRFLLSAVMSVLVVSAALAGVVHACQRLNNTYIGYLIEAASGAYYVADVPNYVLRWTTFV